MLIERVFKSWLLNPTARNGRIRPVRGFHVQLLESRIALSAVPQIALTHVPAAPAGYFSSVSAGVQVSPAHDVVAQTRALDNGQPLVADTSGATARVALTLPTTAPLGINSGTATLTGATQQIDTNSQPVPHESDVGADPSPPEPSEPTVIATPDPRVKIAQTSFVEEEFDPGLLDPLAWTNSEDQFSNQFENGTEIEDPVAYTASLSSSLIANQPDIADEAGIGGYPAYSAVSAWRRSLFEMSILSQKEFDFLGDTRTADTQSNSIMSGTMPLRSLLSGLNLPDQTASVAHQRFAELSALEQSSPLALVATLWTTPSPIPFHPEPGSQPADRPDWHRETATPLSSWKVYVMGLDQAFERSCRDVCQGLIAGGSATPFSESARSEHPGGPEWRMPVVPMAGEVWLGSGREPSRPDGRSPSNRFPAPEADLGGPTAAVGERESPSGSNRDPKLGAEPGQIVPASVPIVTLITGSTLIAGWFWTRRASSPRYREKEGVSGKV